MLKRVLAIAMLCLLTVGCGPWIGDPVVEVIGEVTLDGKVLKDAKVVFVPKQYRNDDGLINPLAFGKTDGTGRFELRSGEQKGVLLGRYRVLIFKTDSSDSASDDFQQDDAAELAAQVAELLNEPSMPNVPVGTVPAKYNYHSELEYVVELPVGIIYPKFDLTSE